MVTDVLHHGQDLLVIRRADGGGECLVPFVKPIVPEVDVGARACSSSTRRPACSTPRGRSR